MILYRKKWRWDASDYRIVPNLYWRIVRDFRRDTEDDWNRPLFPTLVAKDINDVIALAEIEMAIITGIKEVDNYKELKKEIKKKYDEELKNVRHQKPIAKRDIPNRPVDMGRPSPDHQGRLGRAGNQLLLLLGLRGAGSGATN